MHVWLKNRDKSWSWRGTSWYGIHHKREKWPNLYVIGFWGQADLREGEHTRLEWWIYTCYFYSIVSGMILWDLKVSCQSLMIHQEPKVGSLQLVEAVATIYLFQQLISPQITHRDEVDGALRSLDRTVHVSSSSSSMLFARKTSPLHGMFYVSDKEGQFHCQWLVSPKDMMKTFSSLRGKVNPGQLKRKGYQSKKE